MDFIVSNYAIFIIIAVVLLLGLFGYMMDRKKYEKYREEIINEERIADALESAPGMNMAPEVQNQVLEQGPVVGQAPVAGQVNPMQPAQVVQPVNTQTPNN